MKPKPLRTRLDVLLVERGLADSQQKAQAMILAGEVSVDQVHARKAGMPVASDAQIELTSRHQKYASRGGLKLEGALEDFSINPSGLTCLDLGSSTGGFTDCLLQHGATRVYAVDVTIAQLAWKLQNDPRVIAIERNARELKPEDLRVNSEDLRINRDGLRVGARHAVPDLQSSAPEQVDLVVADVSFISVSKILAPAAACAKTNANFLILVKPQFELGREEIPEGGIVKDNALHEKAIAAVKKAAEAAGLLILKVAPSRLTGAEGNQEYFLHARKES
ncbi:MAG TPA: TlyA family RNA methyltransferase [Candidatus Acidoferrum sp.]|nr:TlyA family RNA methyltransferase [Candidatus Acidoferrum sp.]